MQRQRYLTIRGRLPRLIALIALVLLAAMGWLAWRMLEQDLVIEKQRRQESMENAASLLCRELDRTLTDWEAALSKATLEVYSGLPPSASVFWLDSKGAVHKLGVPLPFYPVAYLTFKTESADLVVRDLATGQIRQLTKHQDSRQSA